MCGNCLRSRRVCGGYERSQVFVNRTIDRSQKSRHLNEVKEASLERSASSGSLIVPRSYQSLLLNMDIKQSVCNESDFINWLHRSVIAAGIDESGALVMAAIMSEESPGPLLKRSLLAISMLRFGETSSNLPIVQQANAMYCQSLKLLRDVLGNAKISQTDEVLASATILGCYEVIELDFGYDLALISIQLMRTAAIDEKADWRKHLAGISSLLEYRGPESCQTRLARAIFEHCRVVIVNIFSVSCRSAC